VGCFGASADAHWLQNFHSSGNSVPHFGQTFMRVTSVMGRLIKPYPGDKP
jgi:hypothetical protein